MKIVKDKELLEKLNSNKGGKNKAEDIKKQLDDVKKNPDTWCRLENVASRKPVLKVIDKEKKLWKVKRLKDKTKPYGSIGIVYAKYLGK